MFNTWDIPSFTRHLYANILVHSKYIKMQYEGKKDEYKSQQWLIHNEARENANGAMGTEQLGSMMQHFDNALKNVGLNDANHQIVISFTNICLEDADKSFMKDFSEGTGKYTEALDLLYGIHSPETAQVYFDFKRKDKEEHFAAFQKNKDQFVKELMRSTDPETSNQAWGVLCEATKTLDPGGIDAKIKTKFGMV
ncbi:MAG TPA: hypothetical protein VGF14_05260 [Alphaproteobacteria bacterium]